MLKAEIGISKPINLDDKIACHECDLLHHVVIADHNHVGRCTRCGALLYRGWPQGAETSLALCFTGIILFFLSNYFPLLTFELEGRSETNTLMSGVLEFWRIGYWDLAILVFGTAIFFPFLYITANLYVLLPLWTGLKPPFAEQVFRFSLSLKPWAMMEVFLLGVIVGFVKLVDMADITVGTALYCFCVLILVNAGIATTLDPRQVWHHPKVNR